MENDQFARQQPPKPDLPQRGTADSPCVAICSTLFDDVCRGCGRTVMEVSNWVFMTPEEKDSCWDRILSQGFPKR